MSLYNLKAFTQRLTSPNNPSTKALIHSIEGDIYLLEIQDLEAKKNHKPMKFKSLVLAKQYAKKMKVSEVELAVNSTYDQMIGF